MSAPLLSKEVILPVAELGALIWVSQRPQLQVFGSWSPWLNPLAASLAWYYWQTSDMKVDVERKLLGREGAGIRKEMVPTRRAPEAAPVSSGGHATSLTDNGYAQPV